MASAPMLDTKTLEILDEIQKPTHLTLAVNFHPSEFMNKTKTNFQLKPKLGKSQAELFEVINEYHGYCKLCKQHFYAVSKFGEINSYFQNHINSVDHKTNAIVNRCDHSQPIFVWEKWLYTGHCNICQVSGVRAYIIPFTVPITDLIEKHVKGSRHIEKNAARIAPIPKHEKLMKKLCTTDLFIKKFIKKIKGVNTCLLCAVHLHGKEIVIQYHLESHKHYDKFAKYIEETFGYSTEELLNGFNLEDLIRKEVKNNTQVPHPTKITQSELDDDYLTDTDYESESERITYEGIESQLTGFSPKWVEELLSFNDYDFVHNDEICTLCQEIHKDIKTHLASNSHQLRVMVFRQCSPEQLTQFQTYSKNRQLRLEKHEKVIQMYNMYKEQLAQTGYNFGIPYQRQLDDLKWEFKPPTPPPPPPAPTPQLPAHIITKGNSFVCVLCNTRSYSAHHLNAHLKSKGHLDNTKIYKDTTPQQVLNNINGDVSLKVKEDSLENRQRVLAIIKGDLPATDEDCMKGNYCAVCRKSVNKNDITSHLLGQGHQLKVMQELKLKQCMNDPQFVDPLQQLDDKEWACMICFCSLHENSITSHLKGQAHEDNYVESKQTTSGILKLSNFQYNMNDLICFCSSCKKQICDPRRIKGKSNKVREMLLSIKKHGACPNRNGFVTPQPRVQHKQKNVKKAVKVQSEPGRSNAEPQPNLLHKLEDIFKDNETIALKNKVQQKSMMIPCRKCGVPFKEEDLERHESACPRADYDLTAIQQKLQEILDLFKGDMVTKVNQKLDSLDNSSDTSSDRSRTCSESTNTSSQRSESPERTSAPVNGVREKNRPANKNKEAMAERDQIESEAEIVDFYCNICKVWGPINNFEKHAETTQHFTREELALRFGPLRFRCCGTCGIRMYGTSSMLRDHFKSKSHRENQDAEMKKKVDAKLNDMNMVDTLVITDLPQTEDRYGLILKLFKKFGTIKNIKMDRHKAVLEFVERGAVPSALMSPPILIHGQPLKLSVAKEKGEPKYFLPDEMICLLSEPDRLVEHAFNLKRQADNIMLAQEERVREEKVYATLRKALEVPYPCSRPYPFGSRFSGLTLDNSDFDIFLDCGDLYKGLKKQDGRSQEEIVYNVARALKRNPECAQINSVPRARVPIISFLHKPSNLNCDVSFKNGLSCQNTKLIKFMVSYDWRVKPFILFVKHWIDSNQLHGPPLFSSYAVTMLVIFYLERLPQPVLPTVEMLQNMHVGPRMTIGGWDCSFSTDMNCIPKFNNKDSLPKLILGFFEFYANFKYPEYVISPLTGVPLLRSSIENIPKGGLPMPYKRQMYNIPIENFARRTYPICIMDPFDLGHNLTKSFPKFGLELFIYLCDASAKLLYSALNES